MLFQHTNVSYNVKLLKPFCRHDTAKLVPPHPSPSKMFTSRANAQCFVSGRLTDQFIIVINRR